jgi:hypothetical protein
VINIEAAHAMFPEWLEAMRVCQARMTGGDECPFSDFIHTPLAVAGGAVRDTLLGRPVKDIDVFYREPLIRTAGLKPMSATAMKELIPDFEPTIEQEYDDRLAVWDDGAGLQFIQVPDFQEDPIGNWIISSFPCSLSEVWFDGEQLHMTTAFIEAVLKKQLVFKDNAKPAYVERIKAKYSDFKVTRLPKELMPVGSYDFEDAAAF